MNSRTCGRIGRNEDALKIAGAVLPVVSHFDSDLIRHTHTFSLSLSRIYFHGCQGLAGVQYYLLLRILGINGDSVSNTLYALSIHMYYII